MRSWPHKLGLLRLVAAFVTGEFCVWCMGFAEKITLMDLTKTVLTPLQGRATYAMKFPVAADDATLPHAQR